MHLHPLATPIIPREACRSLNTPPLAEYIDVWISVVQSPNDWRQDTRAPISAATQRDIQRITINEDAPHSLTPN